jgi:hypothetical protein
MACLFLDLGKQRNKSVALMRIHSWLMGGLCLRFAVIPSNTASRFNTFRTGAWRFYLVFLFLFIYFLHHRYADAAFNPLLGIINLGPVPSRSSQLLAGTKRKSVPRLRRTYHKYKKMLCFALLCFALLPSDYQHRV